jgi:hypothetical protein
MLTVEILQFPARTSFLSGEYPATELSQFPSAGPGSSLYSLRGVPNRKHSLQQFFYYMRLPSDSPDIADVFTGRYQATAVVSLFVSRSLPSNRSIRHNTFLKLPSNRKGDVPCETPLLSPNIGLSYLMPSIDRNVTPTD